MTNWKKLFSIQTRKAKIAVPRKTKKKQHSFLRYIIPRESQGQLLLLRNTLFWKTIILQGSASSSLWAKSSSLSVFVQPINY